MSGRKLWLWLWLGGFRDFVRLSGNDGGVFVVGLG